MDETNRLARLRRIEELREAGLSESVAVPGSGTAGALLEELRALVPEAEAWARAEGDARARGAAAKLREGAEGMR